MIHRPCGDWCLIDGCCSKHYPKLFLEETRMDEDAYPHYRRRDNGKNGHDVAAITIEPITQNVIIDHDEIHNYIEAYKSHTIMPVHLPNEQNIIIENKNIEAAMTSALNQILDYFSLNLRNEKAKQYLYIEIPRYYTFKKEKINGRNVSRWIKRKSHYNCIGRIYSVSPAQTELYHLRLLLLTVKGATSFNDLRIVNGEFCQLFSAACLALGLIEDDDEWKRAMNEAVGWMMPGQLRRLFVRILLHCQPLHPEELWENFKIVMSEEYIRYLRYKDKIKHMRKLIIYNSGEEDYLTLEQAMEIGIKQYKQLNCKQKEIVDLLLSKLNNNNNHNNYCFYIDGPGILVILVDTFIYNTIYYLARIRNKHACTMAFMGIAATLLPTGKTVQKTVGLPVPLFADSSSIIKIQSKEAQYLKETDIFIWDEAPMAPRYARYFRNYGQDIAHFVKFSLTQNMRVLPEKIDFAKFLLDMGDGILNDPNDNMQIPKCCVAPINADQFVKVAKCAILSARNVDIDEINKKVVEIDSAINSDNIGEALLPEYLNSLFPPSFPHELRLRLNCIIMLIRNISINSLQWYKINGYRTCRSYIKVQFDRIILLLMLLLSFLNKIINK
ncbi:hypothetical protein ACFW04_011947 [Cataglyphis niger]